MLSQINYVLQFYFCSENPVSLTRKVVLCFSNTYRAVCVEDSWKAFAVLSQNKFVLNPKNSPCAWLYRKLLLNFPWNNSGITNSFQNWTNQRRRNIVMFNFPNGKCHLLDGIDYGTPKWTDLFWKILIGLNYEPPQRVKNFVLGIYIHDWTIICDEGHQLSETGVGGCLFMIFNTPKETIWKIWDE